MMAYITLSITWFFCKLLSWTSAHLEQKSIEHNIMYNVRKSWVEFTHTWVWHESWDRHLKWMCDMWGWAGERLTSRQAGHQDKLQEAGQSGHKDRVKKDNRTIDFKWPIERHKGVLLTSQDNLKLRNGYSCMAVFVINAGTHTTVMYKSSQPLDNRLDISRYICIWAFAQPHKQREADTLLLSCLWCHWAATHPC